MSEFLEITDLSIRDPRLDERVVLLRQELESEVGDPNSYKYLEELNRLWKIVKRERFALTTVLFIDVALSILVLVGFSEYFIISTDPRRLTEDSIKPFNYACLLLLSLGILSTCQVIRTNHTQNVLTHFLRQSEENNF